MENSEHGQKKTEMTRWAKRADREEALSRDVIYIYTQPLIFSYSFLPQRCEHSEEYFLSLSLTHMFRYFLLRV